MDQTYDYLIALEAVISPFAKNDGNQGNAMVQEDSNIAGKIIYICWSAYDTKKNIITDEQEYFIKPPRFTELSPEAVEATQITVEEMKKNGIPLQDAIHRFNEALYLNYISNNTSFCFVAGNDNMLMDVLPKDAKEVKVKLQNHFFSFFNIGEEVKKLYKLTNNFADLNEYMTFLQLKKTEARNSGQVGVKTISRLIHCLIKDGHKFQNPKVLNPALQIISDRGEDKGQIQQNRKWNTFIRGKSPEKFRNPSKKWFIRLRGLPFLAREPEVLEFLRGIRVYKEDVVFLYDYEGKFTGEAYCQLHNEADFSEGLSYNLSDMGSRYIEVFETNENEYNKAKASQFPESRELRAEPNLSNVIPPDVGILKMRGLPYSCTEDDIRHFFRNFNIMKDGIKRSVTGGRPSGECMVIFESKDEAFSALNSLDLEKIGNRFIELFSCTMRELENHLHHNFPSNGPFYSKQDMPNIPLDKRKATLLMKGLPFNSNKMEVIKFFDRFHLRDEDVHMIPSHSGRFSGTVLMTFEDELQAQKALKDKNLAYIGSRYIELFEYR